MKKKIPFLFVIAVNIIFFFFAESALVIVIGNESVSV